MKPALPLYAASLTALLSLSLSAEPKITTEVREENGRKATYMFIDGVKVHETDPAKSPQPKVVTPKPYDAEAAKAPATATVLFDGTEKTMANWTSKNGKKENPWKLVDGAMESVRGAGYASTKDQFGSCKLHIEFATPVNVKGNGQGRGNSGVFLMGQYEVQVLDSYENTTYPDGQCGALYGRSVPLVNASRPPGEWQTYDIVFRAPYHDKDGKRVKMGTFTVFHNGILVQDKVNILGRTNSNKPVAPDYKQPFFLQDHGSMVSYRNIWVRELKRAPLD